MWKSLLSATASGRYARPTRLLFLRPAYRDDVATTQARRSFRLQSRVKTTYDQKNAGFDRHVLKPESSEAVKSGTDIEVGSDSGAYNPRETTPDSELHGAAVESQRQGKPGNPLDVSGANKDISRGWDPIDEKAGNLPKAEASGRRRPFKKGVVNQGRK